jgi:hypothetical protein
MDINLEGIVIIVGNYGSGKTEVAINLAALRKRNGIDVRIADLDLVNPYFRTREARKSLTDLGIEVVLPPEEYLQADLPILSPLVAGLIRNPAQLTIIDVGGNDVGATVLSALADAFKARAVRMLQVVNPFRPFTGTIQGCLSIRREIESAARMTVNGIVGNANLIDETSVADILRGYDFATRLAAESDLPLAFVTADAKLLPQVTAHSLTCPVLPIERQLVPPWKSASALTGQHRLMEP